MKPVPRVVRHLEINISTGLADCETFRLTDYTHHQLPIHPSSSTSSISCFCLDPRKNITSQINFSFCIFLFKRQMEHRSHGRVSFDGRFLGSCVVMNELRTSRPRTHKGIETPRHLSPSSQVPSNPFLM